MFQAVVSTNALRLVMPFDDPIRAANDALGRKASAMLTPRHATTAYELLGAMLMILITGQKLIRSSCQARFQIVDIVNTMRPLTKLSCQIVSAASIPAMVREAFRITREERPGAS
jgi:glyoxylate carboligase